MDQDLAATAEARSRARVLDTGTCATCARPMYKESPYPGVPVEWRHRSSGQPIGWTPEKHQAGPDGMTRHNHRFPKEEAREHQPCIVRGCDTTLSPARAYVAKEVPTGKQGREAVSRRRGVENSKRRLGAGTGY